MQTSFVFDDREKAAMAGALLTIDANPYRDYETFAAAVDELAAEDSISRRFVEFCKRRRDADAFDQPYVLMANCPIDPVIPHLDFDEPVLDKRAKKTTFVAEGFLQLYAVLMEQNPIGYINVNDGDIFQDIHPKRALAESQSQKALNAINFHKDLANHYVRPDWVNILGLRNDSANDIVTCFVSNKDLLATLDEQTQRVLRREEFFTPFDDLTVSSSNFAMGEAAAHRVLGGATDYDIRFFENRTAGLSDEAQAAVDQLIEALHALKQPVFVGPGTFIGSANNECIHNKEIRAVTNPAAVQQRWLMKTVNVASLEPHRPHMIAGSDRVVAG